jgi:hypothetical protein
MGGNPLRPRPTGVQTRLRAATAFSLACKDLRVRPAGRGMAQNPRFGDVQPYAYALKLERQPYAHPAPARYAL